MEDVWFVISRELESETALKTLFFTYSVSYFCELYYLLYR